MRCINYLSLYYIQMKILIHMAAQYRYFIQLPMYLPIGHHEVLKLYHQLIHHYHKNGRHRHYHHRHLPRLPEFLTLTFHSVVQAHQQHQHYQRHRLLVPFIYLRHHQQPAIPFHMSTLLYMVLNPPVGFIHLPPYPIQFNSNSSSNSSSHI